MAKKISQLPVAGTLTGAELLEAVQSGASRQTTAQAVANLVTASSLQGDGTDDEAAGFRGIPIVDFSAATNIVASHGGKCLRHPSTDANARTLTIQANSTLALPVGFTFSGVNETSQDVTLAITTDTLVFAGDGSTGSRTIPQDAFFTCVKVASTRWYVSGAGIT